MANGMNGALLALGVVGAVAAAGRVARGSFATDWRPYARHLLALSEEEGEVDSGDLSDLLERIVEDRSVTGYPRARAVRLLLDAQEEGYLDTGDALDAIQEALKSGSRAYGIVNELSVIDPVSGRKKRLSRHTGESGPEFMGRAWVEIEEWLTGKRLGKPAAGPEVLLWSNSGHKLGAHPSKQAVYERYVATGSAYADRWKHAGSSKGGSRARRRIDNKEYTHYVVRTPTMKIVSGWHYPEDARDAIRDDELQNCKVYSRRFLVTKGRDPKNNDNWATHGQS